MRLAFDDAFTALTGHAPFPWQRALYQRLLEGDPPAVCDIPTGLGKTSVIAVWLLARAAGAPIARRLVYVVNRRTVVDQTTEEVERLCGRLEQAGIKEPLAVSTLRGQRADNRAWSEDPSRPAVICGTVDLIGSRLLFSGYRIGFRTRPLHAGFLGQDALIVHDEAHLEPAFQALLETILTEQARQRDRWPMRVMALTATSRSDEAELGLGAEDRAHPVVARRIGATKRLSLHEVGDKQLVDEVVARLLSYAPSGRAVVVFLRTVDDVASVMTRLRKAGMRAQQLTGTMRGYERDRLVSEDPVFRRFLAGESAITDTNASDAVALVCTSAGEVGVNLSADHLVCDLSTFDSMAQRFGRVNRFGLRSDSEVHVFHPTAESLASDKSRDAPRRLATLALLRELDGDASPAALGALDPKARRDAFAPEPEILLATEIVFDAWAMTSVRAALPGRPHVGPYLHGVAEWEPPTTQVAWRDEVDLVAGSLLDELGAQDLVDDYPLKPHELLTDRTNRVVDTLLAWGAKHEAAREMPVWRIDEDGTVEPTTLDRLLGSDPKRAVQRLARATLLLPPKQCRPVDGLLSDEGWKPDGSGGADVADAWFDEGGERRRARVFDDATPPSGMRLIRTVTLRDDELVEDDEAEPSGGPRRWSWYELPRGADDEGSRTAAKPVLLDVHSADVEREARRIVERLPLDPGVKGAVIVAARHHDLGKRRRVWQRSIGNARGEPVYAKAGGAMRPRDISPYRHELGSLLDAERDRLLDELEPADRDLALHLIAAHHGRARPHFPANELFDPEVSGVDLGEVGVRVMTRFAALQQRFGRWGLAYLESLVRAADYAASAHPSQVVEVQR